MISRITHQEELIGPLRKADYFFKPRRFYNEKGISNNGSMFGSVWFSG